MDASFMLILLMLTFHFTALSVYPFFQQRLHSVPAFLNLRFPTATLRE